MEKEGRETEREIKKKKRNYVQNINYDFKPAS